jgi:hypothetical protein
VHEGNDRLKIGLSLVLRFASGEKYSDSFGNCSDLATLILDSDVDPNPKESEGFGRIQIRIRKIVADSDPVTAIK